ncbi:MAG: helix-turn-helix domain-containing protein [Bacteroidales bacterium]|nr:helix-turn-helix domain-containing protein [Bacteroidales bacterium]MBN2763561.1 helix-turn-helix domain-containing protein [Bacteroidales bacterium]
MKNIYNRQITPLSENDCFAVFDRCKSRFDFPVHFHPEYELNFIYRAKGAKRIIGDHIATIDNYELVLIGPNLIHCWEQGLCIRDDIREITILFHRDIFHESILNREAMHKFRNMLKQSQRGILFSYETAKKMHKKLEGLTQKKGYEAFPSFLAVLFELSVSDNMKVLSGILPTHNAFYLNEKLKLVHDYVFGHYREKIKINDLAAKLNTTVVSLNRFMKQQTGRTFTAFLNDHRISHASRLLIETQKSISEIVAESGFYNQANFNRIFKQKRGCSPTQFRKNYAGVKTVFNT